MIINFPTGLYDLPTVPSDSRSVTFTISNEEPPRTNLVYPKIPLGIVDRKKTPNSLSLLERRSSFGGLIFSVSRASRVATGNNAHQFETGQVLSFGDTPLRVVSPMLVSEKTETQHDLNRFDYQSLNITAAEQQLIADASISTHDMLVGQLNELKRQRADAEIELNTQQKIINEATRNIEALAVIADNSVGTVGDIEALIEKLERKRQEAFEARDAASSAADAAAAEADLVVARLRAVATVLK